MFSTGMSSFSAYVFNGDNDNGNQNQDDTIESFGFSASIGNDDFSFGVDYISNIATSDGIAEFIDDGDITIPADLDDTPAAIVVHGIVNTGNISLVAEYFQADAFDSDDWGMIASSEFEPSAVHVEAAIAVDDASFAIGYQKTDKLQSLMPETRFSLSWTTDIVENVAFAAEIWKDEDYSESDGGTGDSSTGLVFQVAAEF